MSDAPKHSVVAIVSPENPGLKDKKFDTNGLPVIVHPNGPDEGYIEATYDADTETASW